MIHRSALPEPPHRRATLIVLLVATVIGAVLFGALNLQRGVYALAVAELAMGAFALVLILVVRRTARLAFWTLVYVLPFFAAMLFALSTPEASATVFVWVLLIPVIAHLLLGRWLGLGVSAAFLLGAGAVYLGRFGNDPALINTLTVANVVMASVVLTALSSVAEYARERTERRLRHQALTDALTGLANRSHLKSAFQREQGHARRRSTPLCLLLMDLDHFKAVNDRHGHETGDAALTHVAALLGERLRSTDLACRHGGEEFAILLADCDAAAGARLAESLRAALAESPVRHAGAGVPLTASFGVAELGRDGHDLDRLLAKADERLFAAKARGRNCVVWAENDGGEGTSTESPPAPPASNRAAG